MQAVQEIERQRQQDQEEHDRRQHKIVDLAEVVQYLEEVHPYVPLMTISEITLATRLHASTVSSSHS